MRRGDNLWTHTAPLKNTRVSVDTTRRMRRLLWLVAAAALAHAAASHWQLPAASEHDDECDPSYPNVCIEPPPPDLDCADVPYSSFRVVGADPHHFDADHDGIGCEPYQPR
jgi:hypothetical protein